MLCCMTAIERAIAVAGGLQPFARQMGVRYQAIQKWVRGSVPAERVLRIEEITGVSRHDLRPDLYPRESRRSSELRA
jgi:DNA-binding transcriptional regulator YdaS (Cro superfamily)